MTNHSKGRNTECPYLQHTYCHNALHVIGSKAFKLWPNMLSIYMLMQGVGCGSQVIFSCYWYCPLAGGK